MNTPRYRVKTLLIATTIAAVVLACLSPWLRAMTQAQVIGVLGRIVCLGLGILIGRLRPWWLYHRESRKERTSEFSVEARCFKVRPKPSVWFTAICVFFVVLLTDEWITFGSRSARAGTPFISIVIAWLLWMTLGLSLGRCVVAWIGRHRLVFLTPVWLISPWVSTEWYVGIEYHWQDRSTGRLILIVPESYRLELSIPPENVEEVDRILSHMLDPPKYRPPVVPPPPAT